MAPETADLSVRFSEEQKNNILVTTKNTYVMWKAFINHSSLITMFFKARKSCCGEQENFFWHLTYGSGHEAEYETMK